MQAVDAAGPQRAECYGHPLRGPADEALSTEVTVFGSEFARRAVVVASGTHGVEGLAGSGIQTGLLRENVRAGGRNDTALVLVHAINPWGFAHSRRSDHENIDCNRNFVDFGGKLPVNEAYERLHEHLVPSEWTPRSLHAAQRGLEGFIQAHGMAAFLKAVSGGQYRRPDGLFYGGGAPSWSRLTWSEIVRRELERFEEVVLIDLHTGLGPPGYGEIMYLGSPGPGHERARDLFGDVTCLETGEAISANVGGHLGGALVSALPHAVCTPVALEFGTRPAMEVLRALQLDAWVYAHAAADETARARAALSMQRVFYSFSVRWRRSIWRRAASVVRQAIGTDSEGG